MVRPRRVTSGPIIHRRRHLITAPHTVAQAVPHVKAAAALKEPSR